MSMIKNHKQAALTREKLEELYKAKENLEVNKGSYSTAKYEVGIKSFDRLIKDLESQLNIYESLSAGNFHCLKPESLKNIPHVLIAARLAQKMTHKQLASILGLKEQQIQRYESTDYETASWPRIVEIATALNIKCFFEKIIVIHKNEFKYPTGTTNDQAATASNRIKETGFQIFE